MVMGRNSRSNLGQYGRLFTGITVFLPSLLLAGLTFWFISHPSVSLERVVSQFYLNLLCFVTAMLWILWPVLSAGVEDGSERDRYLAFPISESRLLIAAIITGLLRPIGFYMFAPLVGASIGYAYSQGDVSIGWTLLLIIAFIAMCATWSQVGVYWLRDLLRAKRNGQALTLALLVVILVGMLLPQVDISWLYEQGGGLGLNDDTELEQFANLAVAFAQLPPGYLGEGMQALAEDRIPGALLELTGMSVLAILGLLSAKYRLMRSQDRRFLYQALQNHPWELFSGRGSVTFVLAKREIFELWRNPRVRLMAIVPFFLIVVLHLVSANELILHFFGANSPVWLMAGVGLYAAALILLTFTHNTFAYDGRGLLILLNAPVTPLQILKAKAGVHCLVSLTLGILASLFYWQYVVPDIAVAKWLFSLLGTFMLVPVSVTVGLWVSIIFPVKFDATLNRRERQPLLVSMLGFGGCLLATVPFIFITRWQNEFGDFGLAFAGLLVGVAVVWSLHLWLLPRIAGAFAQRQAEILSAITRV